MSECPLGRWAHGGIQKQRLEGLGAVRPNWSRAGASVPGRAESWAWILGEQTRHNSHGDAPGRAAARADSPGHAGPPPASHAPVACVSSGFPALQQGRQVTHGPCILVALGNSQREVGVEGALQQTVVVEAGRVHRQNLLMCLTLLQSLRKSLSVFWGAQAQICRGYKLY